MSAVDLPLLVRGVGIGSIGPGQRGKGVLHHFFKYQKFPKSSIIGVYHDKPFPKGTLFDKRKKFFIADPSVRPRCRSINSPIEPPIARTRETIVVD